MDDILRLKRWLLTLLSFIILGSTVYAEDEDLFNEFEIRVIRPRYFIKKNSFELGLQTGFVANQTFVNTYLGIFILGFHINEAFGFEMSGASAISQNKQDKIILSRDFSINSQNAPVANFYGGNFMWTPMYGKYQLTTGRVVYFDTFFSMGAGLLGISEKYEQCTGSSHRDPTVVSYPYAEIGLGQRFFFSKRDSIRWDVKSPWFAANTADDSCDPDAEGVSYINQNINIQLGYSRFL